jgi:hypothetical protein
MIFNHEDTKDTKDILTTDYTDCTDWNYNHANLVNPVY